MRSVRFVLVSLILGCNASSETAIQLERPGIVDRDGKLIESIGLETLGGVFTPWLESGCELPCEASYVFSTAEDQQHQVQIALFRGTARMVADNTRIGAYEIRGFELAPRGEPQINVTVRATSDGIFLSADASSSETLEITESD